MDQNIMTDINPEELSDISLLQVLTGTASSAKYFNSTQLTQISNRHLIFNGLLKDINTWKHSYVNGIAQGGAPEISHNQIMREMIKVDYDLGGNGLGYSDGTSYSGQKILGYAFDKYIEYGKDPKGFVAEYDVHHINSISANPELSTDPNNIIMVEKEFHPHDNDGNTGLEKADNLSRIRKSLTSENTSLFFAGLLMTAIYGFIFGFIVRFSSFILREKIVEKSKITKKTFKIASKESLKSGLIMMGISLILNIVMQIIFVFSFRILNIDLNEIGIHIVSIVIYFIIVAIITSINSILKKQKITIFLKTILKIVIIIIAVSLLGIPSMFLIGMWKILSMSITMLFIIIYGVFGNTKTKKSI